MNSQNCTVQAYMMVKPLEFHAVEVPLTTIIIVLLVGSDGSKSFFYYITSEEQLKKIGLKLSIFHLGAKRILLSTFLCSSNNKIYNSNF